VSNWRRRATRGLSVGLGLLLSLSLSCGGTPRRKGAGYPRPPDPRDNATRYRLRLRENAVDPGEAFRCFGSCQEQQTPKGYLDCLSRCPGFEVTQHEYCTKDEVPPVAACFTVRKIKRTPKPPDALVVIAVIGSFLLVIGAESLCATAHSQCGYSSYPPPR
jgi:hypothetical protein